MQSNVLLTRREEALDGHRENWEVIHEIQNLVLPDLLSLAHIFRDFTPLKDKEMRMEPATVASSHRRRLDEKWLS